MKTSRKVVLVINPQRAEALLAAQQISKELLNQGFELFTVSDVIVTGLLKTDLKTLPICELVVVLGGDGTILRGAEVAREHDIPLLGINLGHVGFLAEVEKVALSEASKAIVERNYVMDPRMVLSYVVHRNGSPVDSGWALNEVTVERNSTTMVDLFVEIDSRPLSRWGCDGLICSTPTGSTAYAFSAGGPVVWPEVEALVLLPISAHALFARPMVVSPQSEIIVVVESPDAQLSADAIRKFPLLLGDRVQINKDRSIVKLAHLKGTLFTDRLVAKFKLPVEGWRGE
jgi:NAD+ kinase